MELGQGRVVSDGPEDVLLFGSISVNGVNAYKPGSSGQENSNMNNELYRKLTSITLATVMFAGGMTIAIPGELPVAVAQTTSGTLSVSATGSFGGPQVIEIVVDDPDRADSGLHPLLSR